MDSSGKYFNGTTLEEEYAKILEVNKNISATVSTDGRAIELKGGDNLGSETQKNNCISHLRRLSGQKLKPLRRIFFGLYT